MQGIFQNGFRGNVVITQKTTGRAFASATALSTMEEHKPFQGGAYPLIQRGSEHGWIVATLVNSITAHHLRYNSSWPLSEFDVCLPLVCFEGSLIKYKYIDKIRDRLAGILGKFIKNDWKTLSGDRRHSTYLPKRAFITASSRKGVADETP